ncbi:MAG: methylenetetrahydrofolate reductase [Acidobacteriota bacterium]|jgi:methylenetetrahydrofolate reductase (NADPH)|nr:methylenetetrahydrofolate reductase [Acidobacteriota bacterium]
MNKLCQALNSCNFLVTAECLPPVGADAAAVLETAAKLPERLDAIVLPDNPDRIRLSAFGAATLLRKERNATVIMAMTARDRNRCGLMSDALGAAAVGISGILCASGNHQSLSICPQAASANGVDSVQLVQTLKNMVLHGEETDIETTGKKVSLQIGALVQPYLEPLELNLIRVKKKVAVGADFLLTQAVFDVAGFEKWMAAVREAGLDKRTVILPSVLVLDSAEKARKLQALRTYGTIGEEVVNRVADAADPAREGVALAAEIAGKVKQVPGIRGIHLLCGGCEELAGEVVKLAGL